MGDEQFIPTQFRTENNGMDAPPVSKAYRCSWGGLVFDAKLPSGHLDRKPLQEVESSGYPISANWAFFFDFSRISPEGVDKE